MDVAWSNNLIYLMLAFYVLSAVIALVLSSKQRAGNVVSQVLSSVAALVGIISSIMHILHGPETVQVFSLTTAIPYISLYAVIDRLSSFFILTLSILAFCVSIYSIGYTSHYYGKRNVGLFNCLYNLFILTMVFVFMSGNTIFFLISWELMSLTSYFLVIFEAEQVQNQRAGLIYLIMTHIGTAFLFIAFMLLYKFTGSFGMDVDTQEIAAVIRNIIFVLFFVGFGTKAGMIPLHVWLPYAHPAAPSNVSALMSGIMIKTAIYGLLRFGMFVLGPESAWWGLMILSTGTVSTVLGVAYALMEHNIKRLLAYHSIENIGIIMIGLGISFIAYAASNMVLCSLALMAALFHLLNHTLFKGALFLTAGSVQFATHTKDIEELGGLMKRMPYTGIFVLVASLSISAIPPFNGFVSEWMTYQSLIMNIGASSFGLKIISILSAAALAMAGAMAAACFVKLIGISFLGLPRSENALQAKEVPFVMNAGVGLLVLLCTVFGVFPFLIIQLLEKVNAGLFGGAVGGHLQGGIVFVWYPLVVSNYSISPLAVLVVGILVFAVIAVVVRYLSRAAKERVYGTWDCGFDGLNSRTQYSATGFSKPFRIIWRFIYRPTRELRVEKGLSAYYPKSLRYVVSTESMIEKYFYSPAADMFTRFARRTRLFVQTGSVHTYLIYLFVAILVLFVYNSLTFL